MKRTGVALIACGALLVGASVVWSTVAVPRLLKFPTSTNLSLRYAGNFVTFVNPRSGAVLARPASVPLILDRTIRAVPSESSSSVAIVKEGIALHYGSTTTKETNVYALGRTSMANLADIRAYTFAPGNPNPSPGSYYITLATNITPGTTSMRIWKPETGTTYPLRPVRTGTEPARLDGLHVLWFLGVLPMTPVAGYERVALAARGLPMTISPAAIEARLTAAGISVPALEARLLPQLSAAQLREVAAVLKTPVRLDYYAFGSGLVAAEPRTGAIIELKNVTDAVAVSPATGGLHTLIGVLDAHATVPGVSAALAALHRMATAPPQPVYELRYTQTPAAVATMVNTANSQLTEIRIVTYYIPIGFGALGLLLIAGGVALWRRRRGGESAGKNETALSEAPAARAA